MLYEYLPKSNFENSIFRRTNTLSGGQPSPPEARFNILLVFVQFANESIQSSEWPIGDSAHYKNDLFAQLKDTNGNYWDRYNQDSEIFSDWFQEVSKGSMHATGKSYNIILDYNDTYYESHGMETMNDEIYDKLKNLGTINWSDYDLWRRGANNLYYYERDGYIDMIFKIHRHRSNTGSLFDGAGGYAYLGVSEYEIISGLDTFRINPQHNEFGSGLTIFGTAQAPVSKLFAFNVARHEYGHYLLGGHTNVGIMGQGDTLALQ